MNIEKLKLLHDHTKHVTTLSTGSILVLLAFHEKIPNSTTTKILISIALIFFVASILAANFAQLMVVASHDNESKEYEKKTFNFMHNVFFISWFTFTFGMVVLCGVGICGFYTTT